MKSPLVLSCLLTVLLICTGVARAIADDPSDHDYPYQGKPFAQDVTVTDVDPDRDRIVVTGFDGQQYTVDTYSAQIVLRDTAQPGQTGDLIADMRLHVTGSLLASDIVEADIVEVLPFLSAAPASPPLKHVDVSGGPQIVRLRGTVVMVNQQAAAFVVHVSDHTRTVRVDSATDRQELSAQDPGDPVPLRPGERVSVIGVFLPDGTIRARLITMKILPPAVSPTSAAAPLLHVDASIIEAVVKNDSGSVKVVSMDGKQMLIAVDRGTVVIKNGSPGALSDLAPGKLIQIDGSLHGEIFNAVRISIGKQPQPVFRGAIGPVPSDTQPDDDSSSPNAMQPRHGE